MGFSTIRMKMFKPAGAGSIACLAFLILSTGAAQAAGEDAAGPSQYRSLLNKYCVTCHNQALKTAGLMLDREDVDDISKDPQTWEKVVTKLSLRAMPPVGMPLRPSEDEYRALLSYLTSELDGLAADNVNPGNPAIHRLNRTEYANAVRDLLGLEIDAGALLPPDNVGEGFDNIAKALALSPLLMEKYMLAAGKISRLAIGPTSMLPVKETYTVSDGFYQDSRTSEDLQFGSRGGIAIHRFFPMDGEYTVRVQLQRNSYGYIRGLGEEHRLDIRLDHALLKAFNIGGEVHGRPGPQFTSRQQPDYAGDPDQISYEFSADKDLEVSFSTKAGDHVIGITFLDDKVKQTGFMTPKLRLADLAYYKGGEPLVDNVVITGPLNGQGPGETPSQEKIFTCRPAARADQEPCARSILSNLAHRAYRRPVSDKEMAILMRLYRQGRDRDGFDGGIELALQSILAGPDFLFRIEKAPPGTAPGTVYQVSDIDLASRLSFFLWSSIPDEELLRLAEKGRLREPGVLAQQVQRMIADPRSDALVDNFGAQWLSLRDLDFAAPEHDIFPEFDGELRVAMEKEAKLWFESMLREDHSVTDMLTSDYTYVNERLARFYGIPDVYGENFRRVRLNQPERRGMLGKASILTVTSYNNRTSPVVRGKWVLENMLDMAPPPPPADAFQPDLKQKSDEGKVLTLKESLEAHRTNPVCANCHKMMEPIGLALETFDGIGSYRTRYEEADADVDSSGVLFDSSRFQDEVEFQERLLEHSDRFVHTVASKLLTYALGRGLEYYDQPVIRDIVRNAADEDYTWSSLILGVIQSMPFQNRRQP